MFLGLGLHGQARPGPMNKSQAGALILAEESSL